MQTTTSALYLRDLSFMWRKLEPWPDTAAMGYKSSAKAAVSAACTWTNDDSGFTASLPSLLPQAAAKIHEFNGFSSCNYQRRFIPFVINCMHFA